MLLYLVLWAFLYFRLDTPDTNRRTASIPLFVFFLFFFVFASAISFLLFFLCWILPAPNPSVLAVPSRPPAHYENKPHSKVGIDECSFCKQKGHWKAQCPKLLNRGPQPHQQKHQFRPPQFGNQSQPRPYRPSQFNTAAVVPPSDSFGFGASSSNPTLAALTEQFQKFLATQPHA